MRTHIPGVRAVIDQAAAGAPQTHPVPPVSQPDRGRVDAYLQAARYVVLAAVAIHQGATVQATHPTPPVTSRPELSWWQRYDPNRVALGSGNVGLDPQLDGATRQSTDPIPTPPVNAQPEQRYWTRYDPNRLVLGSGNVGPDPQIDGATRLQTHPVPPVTTTPPTRFSTFDINRLALGSGNFGPDPQIDGATRQATYLFPPNQPDFRRYVRNAFADVTLPILGVTGVTPQLYEFKLSQPEFSRFTLRDPNRLILAAAPRLEGATVQDWFLYPTNEPEQIAYARRELARLLGGSPLRVEGATSQATYIFPVPQPLLLVPPRQMPPVVLRLENAATVVAQSDILTIGQPGVVWWTRLDDSARRSPMPASRTEGATQQASYVFAPNQPELRRYALLRELARALGGPVTQLAGPTLQDWFIYPVSQPTLAHFQSPLADPSASAWLTALAAGNVAVIASFAVAIARGTDVDVLVQRTLTNAVDR